MRLPDLVAYQAAVQHPSTAFADVQLRQAQVATGTLGLPRAVSGNFAVTYQLHHGSQQWAVRCFHREAVDRGARYAAISQSLAHVHNGPLVPIEYLDRGVRVGQTWYPITKMAWIDGRPLNRAVEDNLTDPKVLATIETRFVAMLADLRRRGIAHGDLQHGNILVDSSGTLRLVDYDGMFVSGLTGRPASESGDPNYQHPRRTTQFDAELDRFAAIVIVVALRVLACAPRLWHTYNTGDNLLFRRSDFVDPSTSALFRDLAAQPATRDLSDRFARVCTSDYRRVPSLQEFLDETSPTVNPRHAAVLNTLYGPSATAASRPRRPTPHSAERAAPRSWKLRRATVQNAIAFSADGTLLATGDRDGKISVREASTGRTHRTIRLPHSAGALHDLAFTPAGELLAAVVDGPCLSVWDAGQLHRRQEFVAATRRGRGVRAVALSANAAWLAAGGDDGSIHVWKVASGRQTAACAQTGGVTSLAITGDGRHLAAGGPRVSISVWQLPSGEAIARLPVRGIACLAFSDDGTQLVVGTIGGRVTLWLTRSARAMHEVGALTSPLECAVLSNDGGALGVAGHDGSVWLRRVAPQPILQHRASAAPVTRVLSSSYRIIDWLRRVALL